MLSDLGGVRSRVRVVVVPEDGAEVLGDRVGQVLGHDRVWIVVSRKLIVLRGKTEQHCSRER